MLCCVVQSRLIMHLSGTSGSTW